MSEANGLDDAGFVLVTIPIGHYRQDLERPFENLDAAERVAEDLSAALAPYGAEVSPHVGHGPRDNGWAGEHLARWAERERPANSVVVWIGHGESSGERAWLATEFSQRSDSLRGCGPEVLAGPILSEWTTRCDAPGAWAIVVVEACGAGRFVELVDERCRGLDTPSRLALIGAGGKGTTFLGRFRDALRGALNAYESNDRAIRIRDLVSAVEDRLRAAGGEDPVVVTRSLGGATPIRRRREFDQDVTAPLDVYRELRAYLEGLPEDKKSHFIPKAQGAEQGELAWFFEGRAQERRQIRAWLHGHAADGSHGLLVVTGAAGSGKSALLGNLVVHATPQLRGLLVSTNLIELLPEDQAPGDDVFDDTVLLTGLSTSALVTRLAKDAGFGEPSAGLELSQRIDWLLDRFRERPRPFTLLTDALDEAQDPFAIAGSVLRRLAAVPGCRVIVGTRRSTNEGPDLPEPDDENLLDALGGRARFEVVTVEHDSDAVRSYVRRRLTAALKPSGPGVVSDAIEAVAENIAGRDREFLYARLAVHELLATSTLLTDPARAGDLATLLARDHRELFRHAVDRLAAKDPVYELLLEALAHTQGRGLPRADRIWLTVANALAALTSTVTRSVTEPDIDRVLIDAAPYVMLDAEDGQSVYRLAHRTFQEFFLNRAEP
ncbi:MAG: ATP-binding protein [Kineosporiaceae bacterium]